MRIKFGNTVASKKMETFHIHDFHSLMNRCNAFYTSMKYIYLLENPFFIIITKNKTQRINSL